MSQRPIVNIDEATWKDGTDAPSPFRACYAPLSHGIGGNKLGASVISVPPGNAFCPFHNHYGSEEHFYIISGTGVLRYGAEVYPVRAGDYIVNPPGGPDVAHQLINTGTEDLQYLALGVMVAPEIVFYPDSGKMLAKTNLYGQDGVRLMTRPPEGTALDYYDGEDGAHVTHTVRQHSQTPRPIEN